ncbi:hypothetical protein RND81_14G120600 [Saponaria officinalis]|uniref:Neprosin PEP catalytic domain-containing protein n=1 Tax=Saponaria officinalis TaxID=3572 RepID=A0AAW1GNU7_SAPOF
MVEKNGDIIDCVDIYKQPAFDHPLLKNHNLQRRPTILPKPTKQMYRKKLRSRSEVESCPYGSVPLRRLQKKDLLRGKTLLNQRHPTFGSLASLSSGMHYARALTPIDDPEQQFFGAKITITARLYWGVSVYNLTGDGIEALQITQSMLWIGTAAHGAYNSLEYGWTVNPKLYGDSKPRTYSVWTTDLQDTGCYNAICPGYVQVSHKRIMGEINKPLSVFGETVYAMEFYIFRDPNTSNWWLIENLGNVKNEPVGYWPKELFPTLKDYAKVVQLGGKVYNPSSIPKNTPMGNGAFVEDFTRTCYASNIEFVDSNFKFYFGITKRQRQITKRRR